MDTIIVPDAPARKRQSRAKNSAISEYNKQYAQKNADRLKAYRLEKYKARKDEDRAKKALQDKEYRERNKAEINAKRREKLATDSIAKTKNIDRARAWYAANKEVAAEKCREFYKENRDAIKTRVAEYQKANPEKTRLYHRVKTNRRRAKLANAGGVPYTKKDIDELKSLQKHKCANCVGSLKFKFHIDHKVPVAKGGTNERSNIELLCPACNMKKAAKMPHVFAQEQGRLL